MTLIADSVGHSDPRCSWLVAWVDLHVRPEAFFASTGAGRRLPAWLPILAVGVVCFIDRFDLQVVLGDLQGRHALHEMSWGHYWVTALAASVVAGPLFWYFHGWWIRVRARFCGAVAVDRDLCRRIACYTMCIYALPMIASVLVNTCLFPSPEAAIHEGPALFGTTLGATFLSVYASFRAVSANLPVRRGSAVFWFAALPGTLYGVSFIGVLAAYASELL